jgi:hypothetical protein
MGFKGISIGIETDLKLVSGVFSRTVVKQVGLVQF